ncbi:hypothetical protein EKD04_001430 [Chloroflexales bacterium ZM16-3]|nr:hypothetical protein [Chloroflexales bacterium ZM16-3]
MSGDLHALVGQIHTAPPQIVYAFAGAGSQALWELHRVAGSSHTLLEAIDCYAPRSLASFLGAQPTQAAAEETARAMAKRAYVRAGELVEGTWPLLGLGCAAALATDRARRGADRCALAICGAGGTRSYALKLSKERGREGQECLVTQLVIGALAVACGLRAEVTLGLRGDEELDVM